MKTKLIQRDILEGLMVVLLLTAASYSQNSEVQFERISVESGLSQSSVLCICQDSKGFLWFGTYEGLNRYDGYHFKVYKNEADDPNSLSKNNIEYIIEDHLGELWVATEDGLNRFDREKEQFVRYKNDPKDSSSLSNNYTRFICEDRSGIIWVGTQGGGLNQFDRKSGKFLRYVNDPNNPYSLSQNNVLSILEDRQGRLWIGTDGGLNYFDRNKGKFIRYQTDPNNPRTISHNGVWRIYEDRKGNLWLGTWGGGLNLFDPQRNQFTRYQNNPRDFNSLGSNVVRSIKEDRGGRLWIGTDGGGLNRFVPGSNIGDNGRFLRYQNNPNDPTSLSGNSVISMLEDKLGILWIGTNFSGINKYNPSNRQFLVYRNRPNDVNSLSKNNVISVREDKEGMIWIGTNGGGLNRLDLARNRFTRYVYDPRDSYSVSNNAIRSICEDRNNRLWVGTENGLNYYDRKRGRFIRYQYDPNNPHSISSNNVWSITEDRAGNLWVGTFGGGIDRFDYGKREFVRYVHNQNNPNSISDNVTWTIYPDTAGLLWIGTLTGGLDCFDPAKETFVHYKNDRNDSSSISDNKVLCLFNDQAGSLWVGTANGLNKFDRNTKRFHRYSEKDGLPKCAIQGILEDDHGNLWISTNGGLSKFNPAAGSFKNYMENYGLQSNEFSVNACLRRRNGEMVFGGINGFNIFHPDSIREDLSLPSVVITDFQIFNKPVPIGVEIDGHTVLQRSIAECDEINLSYKENVFSFEFAALHYASPKDNLYAYMMEGFEKEWNYTSANRRFVTYTNLPAADYTFRVKASNNQGIWNEQGASIRIVIMPPFWQTLWFKLILAALLVGGAWGVYKRWVRSRELAEKQRIDEALAKERNLLRALIDNVPDYVYVKNTEGRFIVGNSAMVNQFGLSAENEILGKTDFDLLPRELAEKYLVEEKKILQSGKAIHEYEGPAIDRNKDEKDRWVSTSKVPFKDAQGKIIGTVGIGRDITERKRVEQEREILIAQLQNALADVKVLSGLVPICANCKKIRDDKGYWTQLESYIQKHSEAQFSHGICPECMATLYPDLAKT